MKFHDINHEIFNKNREKIRAIKVNIDGLIEIYNASADGRDFYADLWHYFEKNFTPPNWIEQAEQHSTFLHDTFIIRTAEKMALYLAAKQEKTKELLEFFRLYNIRAMIINAIDRQWLTEKKSILSDNGEIIYYAGIDDAGNCLEYNPRTGAKQPVKLASENKFPCCNKYSKLLFA